MIVIIKVVIITISKAMAEHLAQLSTLQQSSMQKVLFFTDHVTVVIITIIIKVLFYTNHVIVLVIIVIIFIIILQGGALHQPGHHPLSRRLPLHLLLHQPLLC